MERPLYVEVSPLLSRRLTGLGRFTARLVEALTPLVPLHLFTTIPRDVVRALRLRPGLASGEEISIDPGAWHDAGADLDAWVHDLLRRPRARAGCAPQASACLYTLLRPDERRFARELSILHDFTPLVLPWTHEQDTRTYFGAFFSRSAARSDKAIAVSQATRADARWLCALPPEDVVVAYPGPSLCARSHACAGFVQRADRLILVVSTLEPRKNAAFLRDWFLQTEVLPPGTELWWVGPQGWLWERPRDERPSVRTRRRAFRFLGMVSDEQLCALYRRATFTIYPSLYEGFGFPVLDALLHGAPVACGFHSSLKEFGGPGVFYFDPCDPTSLDSACRDLLSSLPLAFDRPDLRARCSWDALAKTVVALGGGGGVTGVTPC